jgi:hypothetical protein
MRILATRRQFTWALAGGLAGCATGRAAAPAPAPAPLAPPAPAPPAVAASDGAAASQPSPETPVTAAYIALLQALHGEHLSADELAKLRKPIGQIAEASAKLRAFPLPNSAEPHGGSIGNPSGAA